MRRATRALALRITCSFDSAFGLKMPVFGLGGWGVRGARVEAFASQPLARGRRRKVFFRILGGKSPTTSADLSLGDDLDCGGRRERRGIRDHKENDNDGRPRDWSPWAWQQNSETIGCRCGREEKAEVYKCGAYKMLREVSALRSGAGMLLWVALVLPVLGRSCRRCLTVAAGSGN